MIEKFYLIFWDQKPEIVTAGLRGQPSPDHVSMGWVLESHLIHLDPQYSHVDKTIYDIPLEIFNTVLMYLIEDNPLKTIHSIFEIQICKPPKTDLKLYSRPIYCFNYVIHTIGMQLWVRPVFTTVDLYDQVQSLSGKTNFISRKIYPLNQTGN